MTWFRVGGAGIPATLKNAMNAVFNKKFGTSGQNYPPKQWPDDVNLLGPLPEGTASGPIANFSDGADDVPVKSCIATIAPNLDGVSNVTAISAGKNLADFSGHAESTYSGLTITANANGSITFSGTPSRTWAHLTSDFAVDFPIGTYTLGRGASASYAAYIAVKYEDNTTENISMGTSASKTFTTTKRIIQIRLDVATLNQSTNYNETVFIQLETGNTASTFEPYQTPSTYSAALGRTIYGGTADLVNGQGTSTHAKISDFSTLRANGTSSTGAYRYIIDVSGMGDYYVGACVSNLLSYRVSYNANVGEFYNTSNVLIIFLAQDNESDAIAYLQSNSCEIAYPLSTPTYFSFNGQEINSLYGVNNFWNDAGGDTTVVYRRDIDLALQAVSSSRGLMMASRQVTQLIGEESDPDQVNELVENDETEQEGEDNAR